jgi:hypothetical protein
LDLVFIHGYLHFFEAFTGEKDELPSRGATFTDWSFKNPLPEVFWLQHGPRSQQVGLGLLGISHGGSLGIGVEADVVNLQSPLLQEDPLLRESFVPLLRDSCARCGLVVHSQSKDRFVDFDEGGMLGRVP